MMIWEEDRPMMLYIGTYTESPMGHAPGIGCIEFDADRGEFAGDLAITEAANPSYLAMNADGTRLYAVDEREVGGVTAFRRDPATGVLSRMTSQPTGGAHPCHLSLDASGRFVLVVNYTGGNVAVFPIDGDGDLLPASQVLAHAGSSVDPNRQGEPHPHMIQPSPDGRFVYVSDLGTDQVVRYRLDTETGRLIDPLPTAMRPGMGPRHFAFAPDGRSMVVIGELDSSLVSCAIEADGALTPVASVSTLPADFSGSSTCAHVVVSHDGRFVYGSNRGHDSIAVAAFDAGSRALEIVQIVPTGGQEPRNFGIDPSGRWLLAGNQLSDTITLFERDEATGRLSPVDRRLDAATPVALCFAGA